MSNREEIAELLKDRYKLNDIQATNVLEYAYSLSEQRDKANDFALAKYLNERIIAIFALIADHSNNLPDVTDINRSYVLLVDTVKKIYDRNPELKKLLDDSSVMCWRTFDAIDYIDPQTLWEYTDSDNDYGQSHNSKVNRLCISHGKETPEIAPDIRKIIDEASENVLAFTEELDNVEPAEAENDRSWFIDKYTIEHKPDGTILVNGVLKLKKTQAGSAPERLMEQVIKEPNTLFKPDLGQTTRNISTIISSMGFTPTLRALFFPTASQSKGVIFRKVVDSDTVLSERIDTYELDTQLKKLGATTIAKPFDIPF